MRRYNPGDKVVVNGDIRYHYFIDNRYNIVNGMLEYEGKTLTVSEVGWDYRYKRYKYKVEENDWWWYSAFLNLVPGQKQHRQTKRQSIEFML